MMTPFQWTATRAVLSRAIPPGLLLLASALRCCASSPDWRETNLVVSPSEITRPNALEGAGHDVGESGWIAKAEAYVDATGDWSLALLADAAAQALRHHPEVEPFALGEALSAFRSEYLSLQSHSAGRFVIPTPARALSALLELLDSHRLNLAERLNGLLSLLIEEERIEIERYPSLPFGSSFGAFAFADLREQALRDALSAQVVDRVFGEALGHRPDARRFAAPQTSRRPNLILITIDTLRAAETGFLGYDKPTTPNLDALAANSAVFERAYAMASYTGKALAPMMIGKYPSETLRDGGHLDAYFPGNTFLAERLRAAGMFTMGAASHWYFHKVLGLTQGCDVFDLSAVPSAGQYSTATSPQLTDAALRLLEANAGRGPFFLWVHYFDPHSQYLPHPEAPSFADPARPEGWRLRALYDGEIWFTDHAIGRLLDYVKSQPWSGDTVVAVTADHGESMAEHGIEFQHGHELWESLVRVPLLLYVPGVEPRRVGVKRSVVDLVPTLLDLMRIPEPPLGELAGQSLVADLVAPPGDVLAERDVYFDMPEGPYNRARRGVLHGPTPGMKLIDFGSRQYRLYDLARDPGETEDLARDATRLGPVLHALQSVREGMREVKVKPLRLGKSLPATAR